jgi:hypothetical protein
MKLCRFDDRSGYALLNDEGLLFAVKSEKPGRQWWEVEKPIDLRRHKIDIVDDVPEAKADKLIADYCAWRLTQ